MSDSEAIERRLSAVERAVADDTGDVQGLTEANDRERRLRDVEDRLETLEEAITDLEAATQALRGYVGNVRSVNTDVEERADAALAAVDRLEARIDGNDGTDPRSNGSPSRERGHSSAAEAGGRASTRSNGGGGGIASTNGDAHATLDGLDAGSEMPVPGARERGRSPDPDDREDDEGVLERVRDAL